MHTPQTLLAHVRALIPNLAPAEQRVAAAVVHDPAAVAAMTIILQSPIEFSGVP